MGSPLKPPGLRLVTPGRSDTHVFLVRETFLKKGGKVRIYGWGETFERWFGCKTELVTGQVLLQASPLQRDASEQEILAKLGGLAAAQVRLSDLWMHLELQAHGGPGLLALGGCSNMLYVKDHSGTFRMVTAGHCSDGWWFDAYELLPHWIWRATGRQFVFPRRSSSRIAAPTCSTPCSLIDRPSLPGSGGLFLSCPHAKPDIGLMDYYDLFTGSK